MGIHLVDLSIEDRIDGDGLWFGPFYDVTQGLQTVWQAPD